MAATPQYEIGSPEQGPAEPVVAFSHVSIGFDGKPVLEDISFTVAPGETRILLGPAGSGKSVLLKLANRLLCPDRGSIAVFGREIGSAPEKEIFPLRHRIGMVFQEGALFDSLSVRDNVGFRLMEERRPAEEVTARVTEALRFVEMEQTLDRIPSELSGGMRRRVAIARAIITRPDLLLYDSSTGGLDPITSTTIVELIMKQRDISGASSLLVTHRLQDAFTLATHTFDGEKKHMVPIPGGGVHPRTTFLILHGSRLVFDGPTMDLVESNDPFLKEFLS